MRVSDTLGFAAGHWHIERVLTDKGHQVVAAQNAAEGIASYQDRRPDLVITDMRMDTETAGYDVIRAARQLPYNPATAILTAYPSLGNEWRNHGAQSLLVKPVNTQELLRQIEALLISHQDHKTRAAAAAGEKVL